MVTIVNGPCYPQPNANAFSANANAVRRISFSFSRRTGGISLIWTRCREKRGAIPRIYQRSLSTNWRPMAATPVRRSAQKSLLIRKATSGSRSLTMARGSILASWLTSFRPTGINSRPNIKGAAALARSETAPGSPAALSQQPAALSGRRNPWAPAGAGPGALHGQDAGRVGRGDSPSARVERFSSPFSRIRGYGNRKSFKINASA
jgi:hypothetical protein